MRINLIIQGPMVSVGRSGKTDDGRSIINKDYLIEYKCYDNVNKIIAQFSHLFEMIILSTWNDECTDFINDHPKLLIKKYTAPSSKSLGDYDTKLILNNKDKQVFGIKMALNELISNGYSESYVIRIRTDQYFDLGKLTDWLMSNRGYINDKIGIPHFRMSNVNGLLSPYLADFYFASKTSRLIELFNAYLSYKSFEFEEIIHYDLLLRYIHYLSPANLKKYVFNYSSIYTKQFYSLVMSYLVKRFYSLPIDLYLNLEWRGNSWNDEMKSVISRGELYMFNKPCISSPISLPEINHISKFYFIDYIKIFVFTSNKINSITRKGLVIFRKIGYYYVRLRYGRILFKNSRYNRYNIKK